MAILNVKNFPDSLYRKLQKRAKREHRSVAQEVTKILDDALDSASTLSILALRGLGKEEWGEIDAAEHVESERRTWD